MDPVNKTMPTIEFFHDYAGLSYPRRKLQLLAKRIYRGEGVSPQRALVVVLCSDYKIRRLNAEYRKIDRPTDVLSFPFPDPDLLGEIYISLQRCAVQARRYGVEYDREVSRMFVHGVVHLLGYDHHSDSEREEMEQVERKYFSL